jgi:glycosyltransferase involved in cell wall biosynthesis
MKIRNSFREIYTLSRQLKSKFIIRLILDTWHITDFGPIKLRTNIFGKYFVKFFYLIFGQAFSMNPNQFFDLDLYSSSRKLSSTSRMFPLFHYLAHSKGRNPLTEWDRRYLEYCPEARFYERSLLLHYYLHSDRSFRYIKLENTFQELFREYVLVSKLQEKLENSDVMLTKTTKVVVSSCENCIIIPSPIRYPNDILGSSIEKNQHTASSNCKLEGNEVITFSGGTLTLELHKPSVLFAQWLRKLTAESVANEAFFQNEIALLSAYIEFSTRVLKEFAGSSGPTPESFYLTHGEQLIEKEHSIRFISDIRQETTKVSKVKKILLISHEDSRTGAPIYLAQIAERMIEYGFEIEIVILRDDLADGVFVNCSAKVSHLKDYLDPDSVVGSTSDGWLLNSYGELAFDNLIKSFVPDVVLVNSLAGADLVRLCVMLNIPCLLYVHETSTFYDNSEIQGTMLGSRVIDALSATNRVLFGSAATMRYWLERVPIYSSRVVASYRSLQISSNKDDADIRQKLCLSFGINPSSKVFLAIGTFERRKRVIDIVRAFSLITDTNAKLLLVGDSEIPGFVSLEIQAIAKKDDRIMIFKKQSNLANFYAIADFFVHASEEETMPLVLQEAAIWGVPRIVAKYTGLEELIPDSDLAFMFQIGHVQELAAIMMHVLSPDLNLQSLAQGARDFQIQKLSASINLLVDEIESVNNDSINLIPQEWFPN